MKRIDDKRRRWLLRTQKFRAARRLHHRRMARAKRKGIGRLRASFYVGSGRTTRGWVLSPGDALPSDFCLDTNYAAVSSFLDQFRNSAHGHLESWMKKGRPTGSRNIISNWLDFATIQRITPSAALIFAAEFDRIRRLSGRKQFAIDVERWRPEVASVFNQLGLFQILEIDSSVVASLAMHGQGDLFVLPMRSGDRVLGAEANELNEELASVAIEVARSSADRRADAEMGSPDENWLDKASGIYSILIEAMDNVISHAYPRSLQSEYRPVRRWWMTAAIDRRESKLTVAIFDQGVSIPVSLPHWTNYGRARRILRRIFGIEHDVKNTSQDGEAIRLAARISVSSTGLPHRGKGLGVMEGFIGRCRHGRLRIVSRCGEYIYVKGQGHSVATHDVSIGGTLIEWEVQL